MYVDDAMVGREYIQHTIAYRMSFSETFDCGEVSEIVREGLVMLILSVRLCVDWVDG